MAVIFTIHRKREKYKQYMWVLCLLWLFLAVYNWYNSKEAGKYMLVLPPLLFLIIGLKDAFLPSKIAPDLVEVNSNMIVWKTKEIPTKEVLYWEDIEWIKIEKDGISFYKPSSFNSFLNTTYLSKEQVQLLAKNVCDIATEKNIKLVI